MTAGAAAEKRGSKVAPDMEPILKVCKARQKSAESEKARERERLNSSLRPNYTKLFSTSFLQNEQMFLQMKNTK